MAVCACCRRNFKPRRDWQKYCSQVCRTAAFHVRQALAHGNLRDVIRETVLDLARGDTEFREGLRRELRSAGEFVMGAR